jgi:lipoprotein-anchoring transpeptidase ErfK/SrfK
MTGYRQLLGFGALAIGGVILAGLITRDASAQYYYCDERYQACPPYRQQPPRPQPLFPFGLFQPREAPQPQPAEPEPAAPRAYPSRPDPRGAYEQPVDPAVARQYASLYAPVAGEPYPVPGVRLSDLNPEYLRKSVSFPTNEPAGTIIVDAGNRFLYFVQGGGRAVRYGVGVGRQGFGWSGVATIHDKQAWPDWYPPKEMVARQPDLRRQLSELQSGLGVPGGPRNPLGARAMYLWQGNKDTLFRIHGTFEPWTIGTNVSSGCIRMINQDVIDLYERAPVGAKVVVVQGRTYSER